MEIETLAGEISKYVKLLDKPAVYISGGIDSCIVLHHLREIFDGEIRTYTAKFWNRGDTTDRARSVAEHYGTLHTEVEIVSFVQTLYEVMRDVPFPQPRYNIWPYYLARQAARDGVKNIYIGEGSDEIFGGYNDRDYLEGWAGQIVYVISTYRLIHDYFKLGLEAPFSDLPWFDFFPKFFHPPNKALLREAYTGIIPEEIRQAPGSPPAFTKYLDIWYQELAEYAEFPGGGKPETVQDVKNALQMLATDAWNSARQIKVLEEERATG